MPAASALIPEPAPAIAEIALRPRRIVRVFFADGKVRDVDLTPTLQTELFSRLDDPNLFGAAHIGEVTGGLEWTDDIGLDPTSSTRRCSPTLAPLGSASSRRPEPPSHCPLSHLAPGEGAWGTTAHNRPRRLRR